MKNEILNSVTKWLKKLFTLGSMPGNYISRMHREL